jgi:Holliday junction resolvase RusA-like endonuclease
MSFTALLTLPRWKKEDRGKKIHESQKTEWKATTHISSKQGPNDQISKAIAINITAWKKRTRKKQ